MDCDMEERDENDSKETENHCKIQVKYKSGNKPTDAQCGEQSVIFVQHACEMKDSFAKRQV